MEETRAKRQNISSEMLSSQAWRDVANFVLVLEVLDREAAAAKLVLTKPSPSRPNQQMTVRLIHAHLCILGVRDAGLGEMRDIAEDTRTTLTPKP